MIAKTLQATSLRIGQNENWLPKSVLCLRNYDRHKFLLDLIAGVTVGLVALPLAMAFSIASGLTPQAGIYCAIVTGFLVRESTICWTHAQTACRSMSI